MSAPSLPHGPSSRAVLIGTSHFASGHLADLPSVRANLDGLRQALTDPVNGLLLPAHCRVVSNPYDAQTVGTAMAWAAREADDLLLVYYAGHGMLDDDGALHLGLVQTDPQHIAYSALPIELVKRSVGQARAKARALIVDCCFSGRAVSAMADTASLAVGQLDLTGTYTLTSTPRSAPALAPEGERYTAFTHALLDTLREPSALSLDQIHQRIDHDLTGRGLPRPQRRSAGEIGSLTLVRGPAPAGAVGAREQPTTPPPPRPASFAETPEAAAHPRVRSSPLHPVYGTPQPPRERRSGLVVSLVAAAAALVVFGGTALVDALADGFGDDRAPGGSHTAADHETGTSPSPSPSPTEPKKVYDGKTLTWPADDCGDTGYRLIDLDEPSSRAGYVDDHPETELSYHGCEDGDPESAGGIEINGDSQTPVLLGAGTSDTKSAGDCRRAARTHSVGTPVRTRDIEIGTVWCVTTTEGSIARLTFTKAGPPYRYGLHDEDGPKNPTFTLSVTLWQPPAHAAPDG